MSVEVNIDSPITSSSYFLPSLPAFTSITSLDHFLSSPPMSLFEDTGFLRGSDAAMVTQGLTNEDADVLEDANAAELPPTSPTEMAAEYASILEGTAFTAPEMEVLNTLFTTHDDLAVTYENALDSHGHAAATKLKSSFFHLNIFLPVYFRQKKEQKVCGRDLLLVATKNDITTINEKDPQWFSDMFACFFTYLSRDAYKANNRSRGRVKHDTAAGYCSSLKAHYENKFRDTGIEIPIFRESIWRKLRAKLYKAFKEEGRATGAKMVDPHEASSDSDRRALAVGCVWANSETAAEFFAINTAMTHFSGRCSEVSLLLRHQVRAIQLNEMNNSYYTMEVDLHRQKNGVEQQIPIFIHRDTWAECFMFALFYRIIMLSATHDACPRSNPTQPYPVFPTFYEKSIHQTNDRNDSKCAGYWSEIYKRLMPYFLCFSALFNKGLSSHHGKKASNQKMANSYIVSGLAQIFRSGWILRGIHSLLDYVVGSPIMSQQAGKAVSNWTCKIGDVVVGGMPPCVDDICSESKYATTFRHIFTSALHFFYIRPPLPFVTSSRHLFTSVRHFFL